MEQRGVTEKVTAVVSQLGGPIVTPEDIAWAMDLPAGRELLEFLADQIQGPEIAHATTGKGGNDHTRSDSAALRGIALEGDELRSWNRIKVQQEVSSCDTISTPMGYATPSQLRHRADIMDKDSSLLEAEAKILNQRLDQLKSIQRTMVQSIKSIQSAIRALDTEIEERSDRITEISIKADSAIAEAATTATRTMDSYVTTLSPGHDETALPTNGDKLSLQAYMSTLDSLMGAHATMIRPSEAMLEAIGKTASDLPSASSVRYEAARLKQAFDIPKPTKGGKKPTGGTLQQKADLASYRAELDKICQRLDTGGPVEDLNAFNDTPADLGHELDIRSELEHAWGQDQAAILTTRSVILTETTKEVNEQSISRLTRLHEALSQMTMNMQEVEATVGALGEEFEELVDDVRNSKRLRIIHPPHVGQGDDQALQAVLVDLLKKNKDLRASDAPPLLLLDQADLLAELRALKSRTDSVDCREQEQIAELIDRLESSSDSHSLFISHIFKDSPLNSSPIFAPPQRISSLQREAQDKVNKLQQAISGLQEDLGIFQSSRTTRKLDAFVECTCCHDCVNRA